MADDIKRNSELMRATSNILAILAPFSPADRAGILMSAAVFGDVMGELSKTVPHEIRELMKKVKPKGE